MTTSQDYTQAHIQTLSTISLQQVPAYSSPPANLTMPLEPEQSQDQHTVQETLSADPSSHRAQEFSRQTLKNISSLH